MTTWDGGDEVRVRASLRRVLGPVAYDVGPDDDLWELGLSASTAADVLIDLEDGLGIRFPADVVTPDGFRTVAAITRAIAAARAR